MIDKYGPDYKLGIWYQFSINPDDKYQFWKDTTSRAYKAHSKVLRKIHLCPKGFSYRLYPEFAPKTGRLHYHGYIRIEDIFDFECFGLPYLTDWCHIDIDTIENKDIWDKYISKNKKHMLKGFKALCLPYYVCDLNVSKWYEKTITKENKKGNLLDYLVE